MQSPPILHVIVIGFHHKKGCQVEYSYPSLLPGHPVDSNDLPDLWKHLPSLALPDGAHNFEKDTIYFHLPALTNPRETVFGVSCYRQMNAEKLLNKSSDITRGTVQKSVCVLSTLPLYGMIQTKLELITHAYFDERDFTKVALLEETYKNLNICLSEDSLWGSQVFLGLSVRDLVFQFRHKVLILFKLLLLERKVLFFKSPVEDLCCSILTLCSLVPGMLEKGLKEAAGLCSKMDSPQFRDHQDGDYLEVCFPQDKKTNLVKGSVTSSPSSLVNCEVSLRISDNNGNVLDRRNETTVNSSQGDNSIELNRNSTHDSEDELLKEINDYLGGTDDLSTREKTSSLKSNRSNTSTTEWYIPDFTDTESIDSSKETVSAHSDMNCLRVNDGSSHLRSNNQGVDLNSVQKSLKEKVERMDSAATDKAVLSSLPSTSSLLTLELDSCGLPLAIFTKGAVCLPYLSLPFIDLLGDVNIRSFMVGATNVLFRQKRHLFDVLVEFDEGKIDIVDVELRKQLQLTIEDLRFAENLVQHISLDDKDVFLDGTGWEGGDEWLRAQFRLYLLSLLRTAELSENSREQEAFNSSFFQAWQTTHNYRVWSSSQKHYTGLQEVEARHPYERAQISMADMKLKISHSMQSSEKGKKINQAVANTGKVVMQTSKVVGGAITSAKSFMSSWFSNISPNPQLSLNEEDGQSNFYQMDATSRENSIGFGNMPQGVQSNSLN